MSKTGPCSRQRRERPKGHNEQLLITRLAVCLPFPAALRAYPVPHKFQSGSDPSFSPAASCPWCLKREKVTPCCIPFGSSLSARLACFPLRRLSEVHICWSSPLVPSASPPSCWQISPPLAARCTGYPVATLSPELHTESSPTPHVRVGNG
jgi:hypothetical protein